MKFQKMFLEGNQSHAHGTITMASQDAMVTLIKIAIAIIVQ